MFVRDSVYQEEVEARRRTEDELEYLRRKWDDMVEEWDALVDRINEKGGEKFLNSKPTKSSLTRDDINKMLSLCHPDKHGGKKSANEMTTKLLELRKDL